MKKITLILLVIVLLTACGANAAKQKDLDKQRVEDIKHIEALVLEYQEKTGHLPFENAIKELEKNEDGHFALPIMDNIYDSADAVTIDIILDERNNEIKGLNYTIALDGHVSILYSYDDFTAELSDKLNRVITVPQEQIRDQTQFTNHYMYSLLKDKYLIQTNLSSKIGDAVAVSDGYFRYNLTNNKLDKDFTSEEIDLLEQAKKNKDIKLCDKISTIDLKDTCYAFVGDLLDDKSICSKIEKDSGFSSKDSCLITMAYDLLEMNICDELNAVIGINSTYNCYLKFAVQYENKQVCQKLANSQLKDLCHYAMAIYLDDVKYCADITDTLKDYEKEKCASQF